MLDIAPAPEDEPCGLMECLVDDFSMRDAERLQKLFPGVPFRAAAVALLRDALDQAEAMNDAL